MNRRLMLVIRGIALAILLISLVGAWLLIRSAPQPTAEPRHVVFAREHGVVVGVTRDHVLRSLSDAWYRTKCGNGNELFFYGDRSLQRAFVLNIYYDRSIEEPGEVPLVEFVGYEPNYRLEGLQNPDGGCLSPDVLDASKPLPSPRP